MSVLQLIVNNSFDRQYPVNTTLLEISKDFQDQFETPIIVAMVNGQIKDLSYELKSSENNSRVDFFDHTSELGNKVYQRSLIFLLIVAAKEIFPRAQLKVQNSLSRGVYCKIDINPAITRKELEKVEKRMREYVEKDISFIKKVLPTKEVISLYKNYDMEDKALLLSQLNNPCSSLYYLGSKFGYFYRTMVPSTGYLELFDLMFYPPGFILRFPTRHKPLELPKFIENPKLAKVFTETRRWAKIIDCNYISSLNNYIIEGEINNIIKISEALHEKKIAQIADDLVENEDLKLICIAGPSSSGKTTFTKRLSIQLQVLGYKTELLSIDDYFLDLEERPFGADGSPDFESLDIVDTELFQDHLQRFFDGEEIQIPRYDFIQGKRSFSGETIKLDPREILIIEGIHGLNEELTSSVFRKNKAKIYINSLTQLGIDHHNRLPTTDARLMRRIVRDFHTRGRSALDTLRYWSTVRKGEEGNIFPYNEEADIIFNSSLVYELSTIRNYLVPLLQEISPIEPEYYEAQRLIRLVSFFYPLSEDAQIPVNSILREFIGKTDYV